MRKRVIYCVLFAAGLVAVGSVGLLVLRRTEVSAESVLAGFDSAEGHRGLEIRYPIDGATFPPEIVAPTFRWEDSCPEANRWAIGVQLNGRTQRLSFWSDLREWKPSETAWRTIKKHSRQHPAEITVLGVNDRRAGIVLSASRVAIRTSGDEVGAPLFYREVHLPFIEAVTDPARHIRWRFGTVDSPKPPVVLEGLPSCANCHSFSADGSTMGMDVDYANDKASYVIAPVAEEMVLDGAKTITWNGYRPEDKQKTFGLLPQISPDGKYCICMVKDRSVFVDRPDLAFSQLFFPIRGILVYYDIEKRTFHSLPGADDPRYVQANPVWSPDGRHIVFARQKAYDLKHLRKTESSLLDADEAKEFLEEGKTFQYDLYRIEFNGGRGGELEPLEGASRNGMSNYFPKYSPDGKWIVFCQARSFMLLQPDSRLWIIPAAGGEARRLECNTGRMNSWHSWSPNSRWLVFSSKAFSPYTQLMLTHIDEEGRSSPPVLLEHFTASDKAANIPEFCNNRAGAIRQIRQTFVDDYNYYRAGYQAYQEGAYESAARNYRKAIEANPKYVEAYQGLGVALMSLDDPAGAEPQFRKVIELAPDFAEAHSNLGNVLARQGKFQEAIDPLRTSLKLKPDNASAHVVLGRVLEGLGRAQEGRAHLAEAARFNPLYAEARRHVERGDSSLEAGRVQEALDAYRQAVEASPDYVPALVRLAAVLAMSESDEVRNGGEATELAGKAARLTGFQDPYALAVLAAAYAEAGQFGDAVYMAQRAKQLAAAGGDGKLIQRIDEELALYQAAKPCRRPGRFLKQW